MSRRRGAAALGIVVLAAVLGAVAYTGYTANLVYNDFEHGRGELQRAEAAVSNLPSSANAASLQAAGSELKQAESDFTEAQRRVQTDPSFRLLGALPGSGPQVAAAAHLGAIGAELSRAGESAVDIAVQLVALEQQYQRPLTPADLEALLERAQGLVVTYQGSISEIGRELQAAHGERAQVTTTDLLPPLKRAYDRVDQALDQADTAFLRYQDVTLVLGDLLGIRLPG